MRPEKDRTACRNFSEWLTFRNRPLTIKHALTEARLHVEGGPQLWELTTQKLVADDGKEFLCRRPTSPSQKALQACNRPDIQYAVSGAGESPLAPRHLVRRLKDRTSASRSATLLLVEQGP